MREAALHICAPAKHRQEAGARKGARKGAKELPSSPQGRGFSQTPQKAGAPSSTAASAPGPQAPSGPPGDPRGGPPGDPPGVGQAGRGGEDAAQDDGDDDGHAASHHPHAARVEAHGPVESSAIVLNAQGLLPYSNRGKILQIADIAKEHNSPYVCVTESHLNQGVLDAEISIPGFTAYRSDRRYRSHGGVVTWLRSDLAIKKEHRFSNGVCDTLSLYIPSLNLVLINFYRPTDTTLEEFSEALEDISYFLRHLEEREGIASPTVTLTGDFNFPFLPDWSEAALESFSSKVTTQQNNDKTVADKKKQAALLIQFSEKNFMVQYVKDGTRLDNVLDLFFTNDPLLVLRVRQMINTKLSDHNTLMVSLAYNS